MKYIIFISFILLGSSCSKQLLPSSRSGGLLPDMPNEVPVLSSSSFAAKNKVKETVVAAKGKRDNAAPSISFLSPADGAVVSGVVNVAIAAKDNVGVTAVSISIDQVPVSSGYSYQWNTAGLESGFHRLTATARDAAGNTRTVSITVSIKTIVVVPPDTAKGTDIVMPAGMDQGSEGACVAFAVGYAARSVEYRNATGTLKVFSPEHLFNQVRFPGDCSIGTAMQTALEFIMVSGILPLSSMAYSSTNGCDLQPTEAQKQEALAYTIAGYYKMYTTDTAMIRARIREKKPVIISIVADNSFMNAGPGFIWSAYSGSGSLGHCVVICGYDDSKGAYKVFNSWGVGWGDQGYSYIDYNFFTTRTGTWCYSIK